MSCHSWGGGIFNIVLEENHLIDRLFRDDFRHFSVIIKIMIFIEFGIMLQTYIINFLGKTMEFGNGVVLHLISNCFWKVLFAHVWIEPKMNSWNTAHSPNNQMKVDFYRRYAMAQTINSLKILRCHTRRKTNMV